MTLLTTEQSSVTMGKRGGRFNPLPTSDQSDPALLSHRSIDMHHHAAAGANNGQIVAPEEESQQLEQRLPTPNGSGATAPTIRPIAAAAGDETEDRDKHVEENENGEEEEDELVCGLGRCFSPGWLQPLASKQMFLAVFCLACVLQGMFFT